LRLEKAGFVAREDTPHDRRGYHCVITRSGLAMRKKMWPVYEAEIERLFSRYVTLEEARAIGGALERAVKATR
jgi:DNA-binding MarR family transcriptional regulator